MYCFNELLAILEHGVPHVDMDTVEISENMGVSIGDSFLNVNCVIKIPVSKIGDISFTKSGPSYDIMEMVHPALKSPDGNSWARQSSTIKFIKGNIELPITVSLRINSISLVSKKVCDEQFYSALEKALES